MKIKANTARRLVGTTLLAITLGACSITPEQMDEQRLSELATDRMLRAVSNQQEISAPIDLYEAMARALKYNLDYKVEVLEQALRSREVDLASVDMLPKLVANAGYLGRGNYSGGRSILIEPPFTESLRNSTSSEREHNTTDLSLSWNVLDFGLSYVRQKQLGDDVMIAMEQRRKVANRIIEDVRTAYWRGVSSQRLLAQLVTLEQQVEDALGKSVELENRSKSSPMDSLMYQRELTSVKLQIKSLHREFADAKDQLAALMNLTPGTDFQLVDDGLAGIVPNIPTDGESLFEIALRDRPEMREINYKMRINGRETTAALLEMLPGLNLAAGQNWDSNDYLYNQDWNNWGATVSWNLIDIFRYGKRKQKIKAEQTMLDQQALATSMAVMTQVHISLARYARVKDELETNSDYLVIQDKIDDSFTASLDAGRVGRQTWIRERMNTIIARLKYSVAYADLQNAYANIYASIGQDAFPEGIDGGESLEDVTAALKNLWSAR